jgi:hypothetical protein
LIVAIAERDRQVQAFKDVDKTLHKRLRNEWQAKLDAWKADKTQPNPYWLAGGKHGEFRHCVLTGED